MAIVRRPADGALLVSEGVDPGTGLRFQRPLGGSVELGECAVDAIKREFREELDRELINVQQVGVIENLFTYDGRPGHEIVFVFTAEFADVAVYDIEQMRILDAADRDLRVVWRPATAEQPPLVPEAITDYL